MTHIERARTTLERIYACADKIGKPGYLTPALVIADALHAVRREALEEAAVALDNDHRYESAEMVRSMVSGEGGRVAWQRRGARDR